jgi:hypothetical protein
MGTQMQPMWSLESETGYHPREVTFAIGQPSKAPQVTPVAHATDAVGMFTMSVVACECCLCLALSRWQTHRARRR